MELALSPDAGSARASSLFEIKAAIPIVNGGRES